MLLKIGLLILIRLSILSKSHKIKSIDNYLNGNTFNFRIWNNEYVSDVKN